MQDRTQVLLGLLTGDAWLEPSYEVQELIAPHLHPHRKSGTSFAQTSVSGKRSGERDGTNQIYSLGCAVQLEDPTNHLRVAAKLVLPKANTK